MLVGGLALAQAQGKIAEPGDSGAVQPNPKLKGYSEAGGADSKVFIVPIEGTIDLGLAPFVERVIEQATADDLVMLKIKTFGGRVDAAVRIRDALLSSVAPTVAYVDRRAISAGALISLACDTIIMSPGSSIGAATPVQQGEGGEMKATSEKVVSYMRAEMRATAEAKGRRADLAEAMVDADIEIKDVIEKGKLLTLTGKTAVELELADAQAPSFEDAFVMLNRTRAERLQTNTHWAEKLARLLTDPVVSSLLMTFGFLGLLMELYSPGFGVGGTIGVVCLLLFFSGQYAANLAGWEEMILFFIGFVLLMLELFVIPGFGVAGIAGIAAMLAALVMAMIELDLPWDVSFELGYVKEAMTQAFVRLGATLVVLIVAAIAFGKYFPASRLGRWLVFKAAPAGAGDEGEGLGAEAPGGSLPDSLDELMGQRGKAHTVLRPMGIVDFDGRRIHVLTDGEFVKKGKLVEVVEVDGHRVVVQTIEDA